MNGEAGRASILSADTSFQDMKDWTLVGEYCGVWNKQASDKDEEGDTSGIDGDPLKLGALLHDKVSELGYTNASASPSFADGMPLMHSGLDLKIGQAELKLGAPLLRAEVCQHKCLSHLSWQ